MTHPIIKTDNYILITSDEEIKEDDYYMCWDNCYDPARYSIYVKSTGENGENAKKIIAHLPLDDSAELKIPLLPPLPDEEIDLAAQEYPFLFIEGYKKAKEKYKFTEEDVIKIVEKSRETGLTAEYLMLSFSQPKLPVGFKVAIKNMKTAIDDLIITGWENVIIDGGVVQGRWIFE